MNRPNDDIPPASSSANIEPAETVSQQPVNDGSKNMTHDYIQPTTEPSVDGKALTSPTGEHTPGPHVGTGQHDVGPIPNQHAKQGPYSMAAISNALPVAESYRQGHGHQSSHPNHSHHSSPHMVPHMQSMQQMPQIPPYGGATQIPMTAATFYTQQPHMPQYYSSNQHLSAHGQGPRPTMGYHPNQMMMQQSQSYYYQPQAHPYHGQHYGIPDPLLSGQHIQAHPSTADYRNPSQYTYQFHNVPQQGQGTESRSRHKTVRGPPRKPKQRGHAIWIGNLPPQTDLMNLVHHVCKETSGLESLFLISKSNCAFANFADEEISLVAQQKLHDSKFQSVRLVSRLRKNVIEGAAGVPAPTGPAAEPASASMPIEKDDTNSDTAASPMSPTSDSFPHTALPPAAVRIAQKDRFFILKSLTEEDLGLSVQTGIWATQSHNEATLNEAFKNADNVYLIFSANKSGEYFGYARLISEVNEDPSAAIQFAPKSQAVSDLDLPKAIPTVATEHAPKGRIIDDSGRGTIFWEADRDDTEDTSDNESENASTRSNEEDESKTWGKPFKLKWLSTNRLPFYRTRGLRNPWNSNREVKIARDGTELEPSTGRKLIGLFNRLPNPGAAPSMPLGQVGGLTPGYPPM